MQKDRQYMLTVEELSRLNGWRPKEVMAALDETELVRRSHIQTAVRPGMVKKFLQENGMDYTPRVVAHINLKGGTGKTTSAISTASRAAQYGFRTCIIDMDSQASASFAFGMVPEDEDPIFCDVWQNPADMVMGAVREISEYLYILPSSLDNGLLDMQLINPAAQKNAVNGVCEELIRNGFHLIVLDCPPSLGTAIISTICASDTIVIPLGHDAFSKKGLELTIEEVHSICDTFNLDLPGIRLLFTKFDRRIKMARESFDRLFARYPETMIPFPIRTSSEFSKTLEKNETIFASTRKNSAREDYDAYVRTLLGLDKSFSQENG
ncbi:MAG: ParA family protein [Desulfobacterales bacterium]|nr:ParA family protein [Desulfobacterales bacterium]